MPNKFTASSKPAQHLASQRAEQQLTRCSCWPGPHLSMSWRLQMEAAFRGGMPVMVRARKMGLKALKGIRTVSQPAGRREEGPGGGSRFDC